MKYKIIKKSFNEINKNDYDCLMDNSDQTWRKSDIFFYDFAFLHFAKNWNISIFIYGASLGYDYWTFTKTDEKIAKECLNKFKGAIWIIIPLVLSSFPTLSVNISFKEQLKPNNPKQKLRYDMNEFRVKVEK